MKFLIVTLFATFCIHQIVGQAVVTLEVKTKEEEDAGVLFGGMDFEIHNENDESCTILDLNNDGLTFRPGSVDVFEGAALQECLLFVCPNNLVPLLSIKHHGLDAWTPEYIRIIFDNYIYVECADGEPIDNLAVHKLTNCTGPAFL